MTVKIDDSLTHAKKMIYKVPEGTTKEGLGKLAEIFKPYSVCVTPYSGSNGGGVLELFVDPLVSVNLQTKKEMKGIADKYQCELIYRMA